MESTNEKVQDADEVELSNRTNDCLEKVESSPYEPDTDLKADDTKQLDYSGAHAKTDPAEIALVKKLDWYIMPMLWLMYWLNYLDRNAIATSKLNTLETDLNLTGSQYLTCVSILFVGYILGQHG